ncbi:MAG TPA: CBS domain-containing protein [Patescibacteria group bacterium]|nr:CBS domain-containing protein [Patescibacteria group bacterium]
MLEKVLRGIPVKELRRRARKHKDKKFEAIYRLAAFGRSSELFLWLIGGLSAGGLVLMAVDTARWLGLAVVLIIVWLVWMSKPLDRSSGWLFKSASLLAPLITPFISFLQPILSHLTRRKSHRNDARIYEKEDLLEFLKIQARQVDNRIVDKDLKTAASSLSFGDKTVGSIMIPRREIKWVMTSDPIGPMVMDELHKTGHTRFPVVKEIIKSGNPEIVGVLYLKDLLDHLEDKGRIRDIMYPGINFINESQNLHEALDGFLKSGQYLLIVVNNFEEIVGMIILEDVLEQIFGEKIANEFEHYDDIRSVASQDAQQTDSKPDKPGVE